MNFDDDLPWNNEDDNSCHPKFSVNMPGGSVSVFPLGGRNVFSADFVTPEIMVIVIVILVVIIMIIAVIIIVMIIIKIDDNYCNMV